MSADAAAVDAVLGFRMDRIVEIGGLDFERPALEKLFTLLGEEHRERVGFFAGWEQPRSRFRVF